MAAIDLQLIWQGNLQFSGSVGRQQFCLDGDKQEGISPVEALAAGLAGCMAIDVVHILARMRSAVHSIQVRLQAERAGEDPKRLVSARILFEIVGDVPEKHVARAISLSREKYCSVWHSLRRDIELEVDYSIHPQDAPDP
jgi:putative redox protein